MIITVDIGKLIDDLINLGYSDELIKHIVAAIVKIGTEDADCQ